MGLDLTSKRIGLAVGAVALGLAAVPLAGAFAQETTMPGGPESGAAAEPLTTEQVDKARGLFMDWSCGACHALEDAQASGGIGPSFDGNGHLDLAFATDRITNGQGPMPSFAGQLSDEEIDLLAHYIVQVKK